jgi:iron complex outermembrane receptor protein
MIPYTGLGVRAVVKLQIYSGSRFPLFTEIFGEGGNIIGNPSLLPERSKTGELSAALQIKRRTIRGELSITPFERIVRDMILLVPNSQFSLRPENIDAARIRGAELRIKLDALRHLRAAGAYTYQRAMDEGEVVYLKGKYLPLQPMHDLFGSLSYYTKSFEAGFESDYTGAVFRDRSNDYFQYQGGHWIHNLVFKYAIRGTIEAKEGEGLLFGLEVKNLLDHRTGDVIGYPLPGRSVTASIVWNFI